MHSIFLFTKDNFSELKKTINAILETPYKKFVIDDSVFPDNRCKIEEYCYKHSCNYVGKTQFHEFTDQNNIDLAKYKFLLREPGSRSWNLGYMRNFALCLAAKNKMAKVLFMDEDITVPNTQLIKHLFEKLDNYDFVGSNISGLLDNSIIGYIASEFGIVDQRFISGGFMLFNPLFVETYFFNHYNEDWIWLLQHFSLRNHLQTGEVYQTIRDPFQNYKKKIHFQEFGETILEGILQSSGFNDLSSLTFWKKIISYRKALHVKLLKLSIETKNEKFARILKNLMSQENYKASEFKNLFEEHSTNQTSFKELFKSFF